MAATHVEKKEQPKTKYREEWTPSDGTTAGEIPWKPSDKYLKKVTRLLANGPLSFTKLYKKLKKGVSYNTLSNCLDWMEYNEHSVIRVKEKPKAKREIYSLDKSSSVVVERLKWNRFVDFNEKQQPDEEEFIASCRKSINFAFAALLSDLTMLAKWDDEKKIESQKESNIQDFVDILNLCSDILVEKLKAGTLKPEKIQKIQQEMLAERSETNDQQV